MPGAVCLTSGGQDSTTCLAWALERFTHVETVAFDYRQRHRIELDQRLVVLDEVRRRLPRQRISIPGWYHDGRTDHVAADFS